MLPALIKTMRPRQWTKNVFILAAIVFDRQLTNLDAVIRTALCVILFSLLSSCVYIINDIMDVEADRQHPKKRNRPIASGKLPIPVAITAAVIFLIVVLGAAYFLSPVFAIIALIYLLSNIAYSIWLKHIPILDVIIIASGFVLRVAAGVSVISVERFSPWMYVVMTMLALFMGFGKRRGEILLMTEGAGSTRRVLDGYTLPFLDQLISIVSSTTIVAYSLYTFSAPNLPDNHLMMLTIPFVMYAIFRWLYLMQVKNEGGAPEDLVLKDRPLQISLVLFGLSVLGIFYLS